MTVVPVASVFTVRPSWVTVVIVPSVEVTVVEPSALLVVTEPSALRTEDTCEVPVVVSVLALDAA